MAKPKTCSNLTPRLREKKSSRASVVNHFLFGSSQSTDSRYFRGAYLGRYSEISAAIALIRSVDRRQQKKVADPRVRSRSRKLTPRDRGKKIFAANCPDLSSSNGLGVAGQYPPLAGSEFTTGGSRRPGMIVLKGLQGPVPVKGQKFGSAVMQPWDKTLTDQRIADVLTTNGVSGEQRQCGDGGADCRGSAKELANHPDSFTEPDLLAVPADAELPGGAPAGAAPPKPGEQAKPGASPAAPPNRKDRKRASRGPRAFAQDQSLPLKNRTL